MPAPPNIWTVLKIMFFSTIGTVGLLLPILAIPVVLVVLFLVFRNMNKNDRKGE